MAIEEVVDWSVDTKGNKAVHPTSPEGQRATRISGSFQELQAAIARWRDGLGGGGAISGAYKFSSSTATDPRNGDFRFNTGDYLTVTEIYISDQTDSRSDATNFLTALSAGDKVYAQTGRDADVFSAWEVSAAVTDEGDWFRIPVIRLASGTFPSNNDNTGISLVYAGSGGGGGTTGEPVGASYPWPTETPPDGYLEENGSLYSMTTYEALYDVLGTDYGKDTGFVFTAAVTNIITDVAHGRANDSVLEVSNSGGALPAPLAVKTKYFVINATTDTFELSLTKGGAAVDITTVGTGAHSYHVEYALRNTSGWQFRFWDHGAGVDPDAATRTARGDGTTGDKVGTEQADQYKSHSHKIGSTINRLGGGTPIGSAAAGGTINSAVSGGNETRSKNIYAMSVMKY